MNVVTLAADHLPDDLVALGVPVSAHEDGPQLSAAVGSAVGSSPAIAAVPTTLDPAWCRQQGFSGAVGQTLVLRGLGGEGSGSPDLILVGVGDLSSSGEDGALESVRRASAAFVRAAGHGGTGALLLPEGTVADAAVAEAAAVGGALAAYRYDAFRSVDRPAPLEALILAVSPTADAGAVAAGATRGSRVAESVAFARDLVNEPPSSLTPTRLATLAAERFAGVPELTLEVWDEDRITAERLGGLLGVAAGSTQPPRLLRVEYQPPDPLLIDGRTPHLAMVGKGITFDSGGLSLKTATGMETMKTDMGGAAAVLGALDAAAALGARIRITAFTPLTENMPSGSATKPGDVLTARNGKTIEVLNTDAEGRLVLADGLSLAVEAEPDAIVDLATLTGAAVVALGKEIGALLGNDEALLAAVQAAGGTVGEALWPLPMPDDYRSHIDSEVADMRNVGRPGQAGSISAAFLLREFVGSVRWAHLDIAGPGRSDENHRYLSKGGTGFGVRTLVALVTSEDFARSLVTDRR